MATYIDDVRFPGTVVVVHIVDDTEMDAQRWEALLDAMAPRDEERFPTHIEADVSSISGDPLYFRSMGRFGAFSEWTVWDSGYIHLTR